MAVRPGKVPAQRVLFIGGAFAVVYATLFARIVFLQTAKVGEFRDKAKTAHKTDRDLLPVRGRILDCRGRELARTVEESAVIVYPRLILAPQLAADILSKHTGVPRSKVLALLRSGESPITITRTLPRVAAARLRSDLLWEKSPDGKKLKGRPPKLLAGIETQKTMRREYPLGWIGAKVIGSVNSLGQGIAGVELAENATLSGQSGEIEAMFDRFGNPVPIRIKHRKPPVPGKDIVLTIDSRIQFAAEQALKKQVTAFKAESGECIVMDPKTGRVLALAEYPGFNCNHVSPKESKRLTSVSMAHVYEPGSTAKLVTAMTALSHGLGNVTACCTGRVPVPGQRSVRCPCSVRFRERGQPVTIARMLKYSCNTESTALARRLGQEALLAGYRAFGLLSALDLPGYGHTAGGVVPPLKERKAMWLTNASFGQGVATTRLHLCRAYASVANGGSLMKPMLIQEVRTPGGAVSKAYRPEVVGSVGSPADCSRVLQYLVGTVEEGTGKNARVSGFAFAGKTGSAQMFGKHGVIPGALVASFVGVGPVEDPGLAILVTVEKPKGSTHGATVAAPVFREVAETALWCVGKVARSPQMPVPAASRKAPRVSERTVAGQQT